MDDIMKLARMRELLGRFNEATVSPRRHSLSTFFVKRESYKALKLQLLSIKQFCEVANAEFDHEMAKDQASYSGSGDYLGYWQLTARDFMKYCVNFREEDGFDIKIDMEPGFSLICG